MPQSHLPLPPACTVGASLSSPVWGWGGGGVKGEGAKGKVVGRGHGSPQCFAYPSHIPCFLGQEEVNRKSKAEDKVCICMHCWVPSAAAATVHAPITCHWDAIWKLHTSISVHKLIKTLDLALGLLMGNWEEQLQTDLGRDGNWSIKCTAVLPTEWAVKERRAQLRPGPQCCCPSPGPILQKNLSIRAPTFLASL